VALAVACCRQFGLDWSTLAEALTDFEPMGMRWQVEQVGGVTLINDAYNANPLSMRAAIRTLLDDVVPSQAWLVLGGMLELGPISDAEHTALGEFVAQFDLAGVVTVGPLGDRIAAAIEGRATGTPRLLRCTDAAEAGRQLASCIASGDTLLFKASRGFQLEVAVDYLRQNLSDDTQAG
jgi:UDP-N-acetylmuramyl pentapeptide synthase